MSAFDLNGELLGVLVQSNEETPGLGKKVEAAVFTDQFAGRNAESHFTTEAASGANDVSIDAVSGATISSAAVADAVNQACEIYRHIQGGR